MRGFRIELGEIEAALAAVSGVREAVVVVRERRGRATSGWSPTWSVTSAPGAAASCGRCSRARCPTYMVPSTSCLSRRCR